MLKYSIVIEQLHLRVTFFNAVPLKKIQSVFTFAQMDKASFIIKLTE